MKDMQLGDDKASGQNNLVGYISDLNIITQMFKKKVLSEGPTPREGRGRGDVIKRNARLQQAPLNSQIPESAVPPKITVNRVKG